MNNRPWLAHYDKGVPQTIDYPKAPLFYFLEEAARKYPDRACTIFKGAAIRDRVLRYPEGRGSGSGGEPHLPGG